MGRINSIGSWFEKSLSGFTFGTQTDRLIVGGNIEMEASLNTGYTQTFQDKSGLVAHVGDLNHLTGATFNTTDGILALSGLTGGTINVDLDGRYVQSGDFDGNYLPLSGGTMDNTTLVTNLNAQYLDSLGSSFYSLTGHTHVIADVTDFTDNSTNWNSAYNDIITGATFNTSDGVLTLTERDGGTVTVDLDNRYSLTGHTHLIADVTDVTATAAELNILDLSETALTAGWGYLADGSSAASWRQLLGSEINNTEGWTTSATTVTSVTGGYGIASTGGLTPDISLDLNELSVSAMTGSDWIAFDDAGTSNKALISTIPLSIFDNDQNWSSTVGTVTSIALSADTGFTIVGSPITTSGTIGLNFDSGYSLPTTASQGEWSHAYNNMVTGVDFDANGNLTITALTGATYVTSLDGRYLALTGGTMSNTNLVSQLNADLLDSQEGSYYLDYNNVTNKPGIFEIIAVPGQANVVADSPTDTLSFSGGTNVTITTDAGSDSLTINSTHPSVSAAASEDNSGRTYIQDITVDSFGHITGMATATETVTNTDNYNYISSAGFNTGDGVLTLTQLTGGTVTVDLDGRYSENNALSGLTDTNVGVPTDGEVLTWDTETARWIASGSTGGSGSATMSGLTDTIFGSVVKGDILVWSGGSWTNLGIGVNNEVLMADSTETTGVKWSSGSVGTGTTVVHTQSSSATTWSFTHNLGTLFPVFNVWTEDNKWIGPLSVEAVDANNATITFSIARKGFVSAVVGGVSEPITTLSALTDTELSATTNDSVLTYNSGTQKWVAGTGAAGVLSGLTDTNVGTPGDGNSLLWDEPTNKWVAGTPAGGGNVSNTGTPVVDQLAVWVNATTVEGTVNLTFNNGTQTLGVGLNDTDNGVIELFGDAGSNGGRVNIYNGATGDTDDGYYDFIAEAGILKIGGASTGDFLTYYSVNQQLAFSGAVISDQTVSQQVTTGNSALITKEFADQYYASSGITGNVTAGTHANNQVAIWNATTNQIEGSTEMTYSSGGDLALGLNDSALGALSLYGNSVNGNGGRISIFNGATHDTEDNYYYLSATDGILVLEGVGGTNGNHDILAYTSATQILGTFGAITSDQTVSQQVTTGNSALITQQFGDARYASSGVTGNVTKVGTPVNNELGVWTGDGTLEGDAGLTFNGAILGVGENGTALGNLTLYGAGGTSGGYMNVYHGASNDTEDDYIQISSLSGVLTFRGVGGTNGTHTFWGYDSSTLTTSFTGATISDQSIANIDATGNSALTTKQYVAQYSSLSGLTDTTFAITPTDGQILTWNDSASSWSANTSSGGASVDSSDDAPTVINDSFWFQPTNAKLHVGLDDVWVEVIKDGIDGVSGATGVSGTSVTAASDSGGSVISLTEIGGTYYDMSSANSTTTYTTTGTVLGTFACVLINAASEPTVTGATKIKGSNFLISTDMHMWVQYFGVTVQYYFTEL